jgi:Secretion system C-terminal sorting domain
LESYTTCPNNFGQINYAKPWFRPTTGTTDYYNGCAPASTYYNVPVTSLGICPSNSGFGMAGLDVIDNIFGSFIYREYLAVKLLTPLVNSKKYYVTYYIRLADSARYATNQINIYFGDSIYKNSFDTINVIPQIQNPPSNYITTKTSWTKLQGSFIPNGGENYLYIGNFKHPMTNDTVFVNGGYKFNYTLSYYFVDDVCVSDDSLYSENWLTEIKNSKKSKFIFYPNPVENHLFIKSTESGFDFKLFDVHGIECSFERKNDFLDLTSLGAGIYFLFCTNKGNTYQYKIVKK